MEKTDFDVMAWGTANRGYLNQIYGAFKALEDLTGDTYDYDNAFLLPAGINNVRDLKENMNLSKFPNYPSFKKEVFFILDNFLKSKKNTPKVFIVTYNQAENKLAGKNVNAICRAVKEYYKEHDLGNIFTSVLTSRLHKYKYVDLINVPEHLLTLKSRIRLLKDADLRKKSLITIGIINNFNLNLVKDKKKDFITSLQNNKDNSELMVQIQKLSNFIICSKKVVICLGGRVEGNEIKFTRQFAKKLLTDAQKLVSCGYSVVFVNSQRTPNDVSDFLYEQTCKKNNIVFHNCKNIAQSDEDRTPQHWRIYSGKYEKEFSHMLMIGNIYPGILGFDNLLVAHTMDSYSSCETANAAITTAICTKGIEIDAKIRPDCYNLVRILCPKFAIEWDDFVNFSLYMKIEPKDLKPKILPSPSHTFAKTILNCIS